MAPHQLNRDVAPPSLLPGQKAVWYLAEERLQLGQSDDGGLDQNLAVVVVGALQTALQALPEEADVSPDGAQRSDPEGRLLPGRCSAGGWPC